MTHGASLSGSPSESAREPSRESHTSPHPARGVLSRGAPESTVAVGTSANRSSAAMVTRRSTGCIRAPRRIASVMNGVTPRPAKPIRLVARDPPP